MRPFHNLPQRCGTSIYTRQTKGFTRQKQGYADRNEGYTRQKQGCSHKSTRYTRQKKDIRNKRIYMPLVSGPWISRPKRRIYPPNPRICPQNPNKIYPPKSSIYTRQSANFVFVAGWSIGVVLHRHCGSLLLLTRQYPPGGRYTAINAVLDYRYVPRIRFLLTSLCQVSGLCIRVEPRRVLAKSGKQIPRGLASISALLLRTLVWYTKRHTNEVHRF